MLRILLNNLAADYQAAQTPTNKESIKSQIDNLIKTLDNGKTFKDITGQNLNIFDNNKNTPNAQQIGATGFNATGTAAPAATGYGATGGALGGLTAEEIQAAANVKDRGKINGKHADNRIANRSAADYKRDVSVLKDLKAEFGVKKGALIGKGYKGDVENWMRLAAASNDVNVYDKNGNLIDGTVKDTNGIIFEINSKEHGRVVVRYGADGALDGHNDAILSIGGQAAAGNMEAGLNQINKAGCPVCGGAGCPACSGKTAGAAEPKAPTPAPQAAQMAATNPELAQINQLNDPYRLADSDIKNLIAAIMQLINKQTA